MKARVAAIVFALISFVVPPPVAAGALPPALTPRECGSVGDLVWSAGALHKNAVPANKARDILRDMYLGVFEPAERADAYIEAAIRLVTGELAKKAPSIAAFGAFAADTCQQHRGNLAPLFGVRL